MEWKLSHKLLTSGRFQKDYVEVSDMAINDYKRQGTFIAVFFVGFLLTHT